MKLVETVNLDGPEPDWGEIECGLDLERCHPVEGYDHGDMGTWVDSYFSLIKERR